MKTSAREAVRAVVFTALFLLLLLIFALIASGDQYAAERARMIEEDLRGRDITDQVVLDAMGKVPRHLFVEARYRDAAYADHPLPIGEGQTISQPYIVALMTQVLRLKPSDRVLEIGTGSGYQAAVLAVIVKEVYTIEIVKPLADRAQKLLADLGYRNVTVKYGDGYQGWEEHAPFDAVIITAAADRIPEPLIRQLKDGGRLIMPVGGTPFVQTLTLGTKRGSRLDTERICPVAFVPMTGEIQKKKEK